MIKVVGISGSPNIKGFTNLLLDKALEGAKSAGAHAEKIILNDLNFRPCQRCGDCDDSGVCALDDDMKLVYEKIENADAFVIAAPIYFGSISAQLKAMIDRCQCLWVYKYVLKKADPLRKKRKGIFLCAGGMDIREHFENAKEIIKLIFNVLDIEYSGELFVGRTNTISADSPERRNASQKAYELGISLVK